MLNANPAPPWSSMIAKCSMALPYGSHLRASNKPPSPHPQFLQHFYISDKVTEPVIVFALSSLKHLAKLKLAFFFFFFFCTQQDELWAVLSRARRRIASKASSKKTPRGLSGSISCGFLCHLRNWKRNSWCAAMSSCHPPVSLIM